MTQPTANYLRTLCAKFNRRFDPNLSQTAANALIHELGGGWLTSDEVRDSTSCPYCGAPSGVRCRRSGGTIRQRNHLARVKAARAILRS